MFNLFSKPSILEEIGQPRITRLLRRYQNDFLAANLYYPDPDQLNGTFLESVAALFSNPEAIPVAMRETLLALEVAASPASEALLQTTVDRAIPRAYLGGFSQLNIALELWFSAPAELSQFVPKQTHTISQNETHEPNGATITNQDSEIKNAADIPLPPTVDGGEEVLNPESQTLPANPINPQMAFPSIKNQNSKFKNPSRPRLSPEDDRVVQRLARLSTFDYDRVRKEEAAKLRIRAEVLDSEVNRVRNEIEYEASVQETLSRVTTWEPWHEPITDSPALLHAVAECCSRYLALPLGAPDAMSLFNTHTFVVNAFVQTPRLNLSSKDGGCGKTTALDVLASMCQRPLRTENMSGAVLYRVVEQIQPTLLLDELDAWLPGNEEFRGLLNAGHKHDAVVFRCEGEGIKDFNAFCPVVLAGIGKLPQTLDDRSIHIPLVKALPGQISTHFDRTQLETEHILARKLARWAKDNFDKLRNLRPTMPPEAYNRLGDNWRPLFAIAQVVGGDWPARVLAAFHHLSPKPQPVPTPDPVPEPAQDLDQLLLADICLIFADLGLEKIRSR